MFSNSLDLIVLIVFISNLLIATILMIRKVYTNQYAIPADLKKILIRLFSVQTFVTCGMHIQMPYKYQLYLENGLTHTTVSKIICYNHLITFIWNILLPFGIRFFGHRLLICFASLCFVISSFIIGQSNASINAFILASAISGLTMPTIVRCFQDIWQLEEKNMPSNWKANYLYNEIRSFVSLITTWIISPLSSFIATNYGTRNVFNFSSILILLFIIPTYILIKNPPNSTSEEGQSVTNDLVSVFEQFKTKKITYFVISLDIFFSIGMFLFHQRSSAFLLTTEHQPPMGFVSGAYGVLDLIGAQVISLFSYFLPYQAWLAIFSFLMGLNMVLVFLAYNHKIFVFICICMNSFVHSGIMANSFFLHKEYYPSDLRNYFMTLIRAPTSIISFLILWFWKSEEIEYYAMIAGFLLFITSLHSLLLKWKDENLNINPTDENALLQIEEDENEEKDEINLEQLEDDTMNNDEQSVFKEEEKRPEEVT